MAGSHVAMAQTAMLMIHNCMGANLRQQDRISEDHRRTREIRRQHGCDLRAKTSKTAAEFAELMAMRRGFPPMKRSKSD